MKNEFSNSSDEEIKLFYKNISTRVKLFRNKKGVTQLDLALDMGIKSVAFYSNCESNRYQKHFNLGHLYKISKSLQINICDLIKENENGESL